MGTIRVLIADDQKLMREGLTVLLDHAPGISLVGQARDGKEAVELAQQLLPDVVLMDVKMPRLDGLKATQAIAEQLPATKILMVTQSLDEMLIRTAIEQGASGYVSKTDTFDELVPAILALQSNQFYFSKSIHQQYPHVAADESQQQARCRLHNWQDAAWADLEARLERAVAEAQANRDRVRSVFRESTSLRTQTRQTRAFSEQIRQLRHPGAPSPG